MRNIKKGINLLLVSVFITACMVVFWVWMLHVTQPATASNTYYHQERISEVEIRAVSHRGNDKLYIFTQSNHYMLDTGWQNQEKSKELANKILSINAPVTVTVWEHFPKWFRDPIGISWNVEQVVDLRSDSGIYWDILTHNKLQRRERTSGIVSGIIFSVIIVLYDFIACYIMIRRKRLSIQQRGRSES